MRTTFPHKAGYTVLTTTKTPGLELGCDPGRAVSSTTPFPDFFNLCHKTFVLLVSLTQTASEIRIISAPTDSQNPAHLPHLKPGAVLLHKAILHLGRFEKMANAFFKIARSSSRSAILRFNLNSSSSWGFIWPMPGNECSLSCRYSCFHLCSISSWMPKSRATPLLVRLPSRMSLTAPSLNYRSYLLRPLDSSITHLQAWYYVKLFGMSTKLGEVH